MDEKDFQAWLDSIKDENDCPFMHLPVLTVGQAKRLYKKYLEVIDDSFDLLIEESKKRLNMLQPYPDHWGMVEALQVESILCYQDKL